MSFSLDMYEDELIRELEELPIVSRAKWEDSCAQLALNGCDESLLDEFAPNET